MTTHNTDEFYCFSCGYYKNNSLKVKTNGIRFICVTCKEKGIKARNRKTKKKYNVDKLIKYVISD